MLSTLLIGTGLALDIIGAFTIVIPDMPGVRELFKFGKLRKGRVLMEADGVRPGETGFDEIVEIVGHICDFRDDESVRKIRMHSRGGSGMTAEETVWVYYEDHWDPDSTDTVGVGSVYKRLTKELDSAEARFRVVGFLMLASGFSLQLAGTVLV